MLKKSFQSSPLFLDIFVVGLECESRLKYLQIFLFLKYFKCEKNTVHIKTDTVFFFGIRELAAAFLIFQSTIKHSYGSHQNHNRSLQRREEKEKKVVTKNCHGMFFLSLCVVIKTSCHATQKMTNFFSNFDGSRSSNTTQH